VIIIYNKTTKDISWSQSDMNWAIDYQKYWLKGFWAGPGSPMNPEVRSAFGFAGEGYTGQSYDPASNGANCSQKDVKVWPAEPMAWKWSGIRKVIVGQGD
jgi:hypothetical protein